MDTIEYILSFHEKVKLFQYGSTEYNDAIALRYEILRKPLNLQFTFEQLAAEKHNYHFGYYIDDKLIACLMLVPEAGGNIKMKQVAVANEWQRKGIGAKLVLVAEEFAVENGFNLIYCNARDSAVPFYKKSGYTIKGEMFAEVSIPHYYMEKKLNSKDK